MQDLNCLIVEDEPLAAKVIETYIHDIPGLKLKGICEDVFSANKKLQSEKIDLIFLDINLPKVNGLEFIKSLTSNYHIILTTAYHQYALEGFNLNVVDYLLKPIDYSRFLKAINKVYSLRTNRTNPVQAETSDKNHYFFVVDKKRIKINFDDILYIESLKDYVKIHTDSKTIVTKFQIGEIEQLLDEKKFTRVHKSFIINLNHVTAYNANEVELSGHNLPIGRTYSEHFKKQIETRL